MKATTIILVAFVACAICQNFPSSSQTWKNQGPNERIINITGVEPLKYSNGYVNLAFNIPQGSGTVFYGVGDRKYNLTISRALTPTYELYVPFCTLGGSADSMSYYVYLESATDLSYEVTLTQTSLDLPNNETRAVNLVPNAFKGLPFLISTGDKDVTKKFTVAISSGVPLDNFMDVVVMEARQNCAAEALQLQSFPVVSNVTTWTFTAQFDAGFENYTIKFVPRDKQSVFSSFYINAIVNLGPKDSLGKWVYLIIGGVAVVVVVAVIAVIVYVRRPKGYVRIQANY